MEQLIKQIMPAQALLDRFGEILKKWQKAVNLISQKDEAHLWERHILDSAQVYFLLPENASVMVDFGSGGGFPGLVVAILNKCFNGPLTDIYLIESDIKKCVFLQEAARELGVRVHIINKRIEEVKNIQADVITARGFAVIQKILEYGLPFLKEQTVFLLPKGEKAPQEINEIRYRAQVNLVKSVIQKNSYIVQISEVCEK